MEYKVHYTAIMGIDLIVEADSEEEAMEQAEIMSEDITLADMEFEDSDTEIIEELSK